MDDAGTVELSATYGQDLLDIHAGIVADQAALRALQGYVRTVCLLTNQQVEIIVKGTLDRAQTMVQFISLLAVPVLLAILG
nr:lysis protein [Pseudomonas typographi]